MIRGWGMKGGGNEWRFGDGRVGNEDRLDD